MAFTYFLPDENGNKTEHGTTSNAVIIIGANGSGKSKLGGLDRAAGYGANPPYWGTEKP